MESCYKLYTWINHTVLMLLLQILWKMSQISDYFREKSVDEIKSEKTAFIFAPLTKESKLRRHIRSMSDVQSSTPYKTMYRARKGSTQSLVYDSDSRARRIHAYNRLKEQDSSDSSDYLAAPRKMHNVHRIIKHADSMRIL